MTITLITGANKGIGHETARQLIDLGHTVYLGARDPDRGEQAAADLGARFVQLDVTDDASVGRALDTVAAEQGRLDVLVNNAGVLGFHGGPPDGPTALEVLDTNVAGVVRVTEAALPLLARSSNPTVVMVSSSAGSFWAVTNPERPEFGLPTILYSASKAAVTMLAVQYAKSRPGMTVNAVEPGTTATDLTAAFGVGRSVQDSAAVVVRFATLGPGGPTGTFSDENGPVPW